MEEILMELQIEIAERLLIHTNDVEIRRITDEAQARARLLNNILSYGLVTNESLRLLNTTQALDNFVFSEQLKTNKVLAADYKAGRKNLMGAFALPENLQGLKDAVNAWISYPFQNRGGNKYSYLRFSEHWTMDTETLEREFEMRSLKLYVEGELLSELKQLQNFGEYLNGRAAEPGQVFSNIFLNQRFTSDRSQACNSLPPAKFMLKASYFRH